MPYMSRGRYGVFPVRDKVFSNELKQIKILSLTSKRTKNEEDMKLEPERG
jgi:hypothetical protein